MHPLTLPRADSTTYLIHLFGTGLDADESFVVERFRSLADGDIVPVDARGRDAKGRRARRRTVVLLAAVEKLRPAPRNPTARPAPATQGCAPRESRAGMLPRRNTSARGPAARGRNGPPGEAAFAAAGASGAEVLRAVPREGPYRRSRPLGRRQGGRAGLRRLGPGGQETRRPGREPEAPEGPRRGGALRPLRRPPARRRGNRLPALPRQAAGGGEAEIRRTQGRPALHQMRRARP